MNRLAWPLVAVLCLSGPLLAVEPLNRQLAKSAGDVDWYDVEHLDVEGQGWAETKSPFDRLPAKAEGTVRDAVWGLSRHSAGLCVRFVTPSPTIHCRWALISDRLAMPHMPATGVSGVDLYVKTEKGWRWLAVGQPSQKENAARLVSGISAEPREFLLYFPLYNGVSSVEIGVATGASLAKAEAWPNGSKPVVFYGTSITQGGCASRPGMVHTAILQRRLNRPVINLGFSGNGKMEIEMAALFAELDPAVLVLDCLPNMTASEVTERVEPFVNLVRAARPDTPILLVEDRSYTDSFLVASKRERNESSRAALKAAHERLVKKDIQGLHYLEGEHLIGDDGEGTVDSSHPTDLGFVRQADAFEAALKPILK